MSAEAVSPLSEQSIAARIGYQRRVPRFGIIAAAGCATSFFMIETRRRVLEEVSP